MTIPLLTAAVRKREYRKIVRRRLDAARLIWPVRSINQTGSHAVVKLCLLLATVSVAGCTNPTAPAPTEAQDGLLIMGQDGTPVTVRT